MKNSLIPQQTIEQRIFLIRGLKVMIDRDLAELYGVETKYLNRQVRRNPGRFPGEFCFRLTKSEKRQLVTICHRFRSMRHSSSSPYVFTEHGVAMLASVLNSKQAVAMSILIIKTFVKLRKMADHHKDLADKISELEKKYADHDNKIQLIFEAIKKLLEPPPEPPAPPPKPPIGFR